MPDLCTIETRHTDRSTAVRLIGEIDASNAASIDAELRAIAAAARTYLVIDLNELEYIDSAGIAVLERLTNDMQCRIAMSSEATVYETLKVVGFNARQKLYRSASDALG
jgi:anti-anti-sigma factor